MEEHNVSEPRHFSELAVRDAILDLKRIDINSRDHKNFKKFQRINNNNNNDLEQEKQFEPATQMTSTETDNGTTSESEAEEPLDIIDAQSGGSGDEGTWLYQSPSSKSGSSSLRYGRNMEDSVVMNHIKRKLKSSPVDWLRRDLDETPSPDVLKARSSLLNKLDEITKGRLDTQTFRIRDSKNQVRKSLQELINVAGPHQATATQTSGTSGQDHFTEDVGMQTSFVDEALRRMIPGSTLTLPRSAGRKARPPPTIHPLNPSAPISAPRGHLTPMAENPDSSYESEVYYEALEYPVVEDDDDDDEASPNGDPPVSTNTSPFARSPRYRTFTRKTSAVAQNRIESGIVGGVASARSSAESSLLRGRPAPLPLVKTGGSNEGRGSEPKPSPSERLERNKPKILGTATVTRSIGRRLLAPRENGVIKEVGSSGDGGSTGVESDDSHTRPGKLLLSTSYTIATHEDDDNNDRDLFSVSNRSPFVDGGDVDEVFAAPSFDHRRPRGGARKPLPQFRGPETPGTPGSGASTPGSSTPRTPNAFPPEISGRRRGTASSTGDLDVEETPELEFDESDFLTTLTICGPSLHSTEDIPPKAKTTTTTTNQAGKPAWESTNFDKPVDMVDVQVMARMQEDSLRKSIIGSRNNDKPKLTGIVQPLTSQNGVSGRGLEMDSALPSPYARMGPRGRRTGSGTADESRLAKSSIGREDSASSVHSMDSNAGARSGSDSVHSATPPDSPLGGSRSDLHLGSRASPSGRRASAGLAPPSATRRSLPNLAQTAGAFSAKTKPSPLKSKRPPQNTLKSHTSESNLQEKSSLRQPTIASRLKPPSARSISPVGASPRTASPGIPRGVVTPTPRTTPSRGSSIARPTRGTASTPKSRGIPRAGTSPAAAAAVAVSPQSRRAGVQTRGSSKNVLANWEEDYY